MQCSFCTSRSHHSDDVVKSKKSSTDLLHQGGHQKKQGSNLRRLHQFLRKTMEEGTCSGSTTYSTSHVCIVFAVVFQSIASWASVKQESCHGSVSPKQSQCTGIQYVRLMYALPLYNIQCHTLPLWLWLYIVIQCSCINCNSVPILKLDCKGCITTTLCYPSTAATQRLACTLATIPGRNPKAQRHVLLPQQLRTCWRHLCLHRWLHTTSPKSKKSKRKSSS